MPVHEGMRAGRDVLAGYQRAWGLQYGDLQEQISSDPFYHEAAMLSEARTVVTAAKRMNLYLLLRFYLQKLMRGNVIEFGSYNGGTAIFLAMVAKRFLPDVQIIGFDTFTGIPIPDRGIDAHSQGDLWRRSCRTASLCCQTRPRQSPFR
jgi:hypothetical protein